MMNKLKYCYESIYDLEVIKYFFVYRLVKDELITNSLDIYQGYNLINMKIPEQMVFF